MQAKREGLTVFVKILHCYVPGGSAGVNVNAYPGESDWTRPGTLAKLRVGPSVAYRADVGQPLLVKSARPVLSR